LQDRDTLADSLTQKDKEIHHLQDQIKEKITFATNEKEAFHVQLSRKDEDLRKKDEEIRSTRNETNDKQAIIDQFEHTLKSRDLTLHEKDSSLRQMKELLTEKEKRIATLLDLSATQTAKADSANSGDATEIAERKLKEALIRIATKEEEMNTKSLEITKLQGSLDQLQLQYNEEKRKADKGKEVSAAKEASETKLTDLVKQLNLF